MEALVWETAEELDKKLAERMRRIRSCLLYTSTLCAVAPFLGVAPSGVPLEAGDPLGVFGGDAVLGIAVALALFAALAILGAAWFSKREAA